MQLQLNRNIVTMPFSSYIVTVAVTPTPLSPVQNKSNLVDSFIISLDAGAANNIFMGDQGVTVATGVEIVAGGGPVNFRIPNQDQQYDTQTPLIAIANSMQCRDNQPVAIPFIVWDMSQIYLIAVAPTVVRVVPFPSQFI